MFSFISSGDGGAPFVARVQDEHGNELKTPVIVALLVLAGPAAGFPGLSPIIEECVGDRPTDDEMTNSRAMAVDIASHMGWILHVLDNDPFEERWEGLELVYESWTGDRKRKPKKPTKTKKPDRSDPGAGPSGEKRPKKTRKPDRSDPGAGPSGEKRKKTSKNPRKDSRGYFLGSEYYEYDSDAITGR